MGEMRFDEIGYWTEIKLDIVCEYASAYSTIMRRQAAIQRYLYIDGFAGPGVHLSRRSGEYILGSPLNALNVQPPFHEYHFIDLDGNHAGALRELCRDHENVFVYEGDCNQILPDEVLPRARYSQYRRALCLLDPYGLDLDWRVIREAGNMKSIEIFLNFPIMDMNRNVLWKDPEGVSESQAMRMDAFWGDRTWRDVAYRARETLFGPIQEKAGNPAIATAFRKRLRDVAGFAYVPEPIPMRNSKGAVVYYLFFATRNRTGNKIVLDIFRKYANRGVQQ